MRRSSLRRRRLGEEIGILSVWLVVFLVMCLLSDRFRSYSNILILLLNGSVIAFLALGQAFVLLTGGIDLSTGSTVAMTGVLCTVMMQLGLPWPLASLIGLASGVFLGLFNGAIIHYVKIPPFIVTFSTYGVATSVPMILAEAQSISVADERFSVIGNGQFLTVPMPVVLVTIAALIGYLVLRRTRLGVHIYAVGGNAEAAGLAGVNVALTTISVYAISGFCAGMGGLITTSRLMVGYPSAGSGNELFFSIAAAVVGGVSLFGGVGSVLGAMLGALLIATISNGMTLLSVPSFWQPLVIGLIILFGVIVDTYRRRFSEVRRAVQVLRSKAVAKPSQDERGARTPVVENVTGKQGASQSNFRSGSQEEDRS
ncbi:MAG: ribose transport system permease protein [Verrucomicrobiota bacterium]|jgi:ribose transport system permease protein